MNSFFLKIYDFLSRNRKLCVLSFLILTIGLSALLLRLDFKEDISDFLPLDGRQQESMAVYQDVAGASKLLALFQHKDTLNADPDIIVGAIEDFERILAEQDTSGILRNVLTNFDLESVTDMTDFAYASIPYFLTDSDYERMDSLLAIPGYMAHRLDEDKQMLVMPASGMLSANLQKDPLNLFTPVVSRMQRGGSGLVEMYDGRMFMPDMKRAVAIMESPYGNSETQHNAELMQMLNCVADSVTALHTDITLHYIGGPAIAVGNADRIKRDSVLSIAIALVLITLLLICVFNNGRNLLLIVISVSWGMLFALAMLSVVHSNVSLIVVGISSIILGIAVNYPLHLIAHLDHTSTMRQSLREIIAPLVVGNVTTVGAFLALVPLKAAALRDLGIFSAFILIGTIIFTVVYLPHVAKQSKVRRRKAGLIWLEKISAKRLETSRWLVIAVCLLTCVFAYFSTRTQFDSDMSHINYMTDRQRGDMEYFSALTAGVSADTRSIYVVSEGKTIEDALNNSLANGGKLHELADADSSVSLSTPHGFYPSKALQTQRLARWREFVNTHRELLTTQLRVQAAEAGFSTAAFDEFWATLNAGYDVQDPDYFAPLYNIWRGNVSFDESTRTYRAVDELRVPADKLDKWRTEVERVLGDGQFSFDVPSMNSALANGLSDNFNYIGWACGLIVFLFLWFSFSSIELAALSFLPMAVSWIWIMGIMGMTGIQFNIVNIILATFIFGQGDDYTIFMTEGCCYEYACRRRMLASYKTSIIISALIMFIGIGTLIFAKHPALRSLAEVTVVGMFSVVLMAWLLPPVVFRWVTMSRGQYRRRPLTLASLLRTWFCGAWWLTQLLVGYLLGGVMFAVFGRNARTIRIFHRFVTWSHRIDLKLMPGVRFQMSNPEGEMLERPAVIVCNHQSMLDPLYLMAWSPKLIIVANERSSHNPVVRVMFRWLRFYTVSYSNFTAWKDSSLERDMHKFRSLVEDGYSIAFFPEGKRNPDSDMLRWHKGAFYVASELGLDIVPVLLHGVNNLMPIHSFACYSGGVNMQIWPRITPGTSLWSYNYAEMTHKVHMYMVSKYEEMRRKTETAEYFVSLVKDRYRYKGVEIWQYVRRTLREKKILDEINLMSCDVIEIKDAGYGERALLAALVHPESRVIATVADDYKRDVAYYAALDIVDNLEIKIVEE